MRGKHVGGWIVLAGILCGAALAEPRADEARGWLHWRGPQQNGTTLEKGLPEKAEELWSIDLSGRGTPVIAGDRLYSWGYRGEGAQLREVLACLDAATGKTIWEHTFRDFLSDVVYDRYSIGAPTIDAETSNIYLVTSPGVLVCYTRDGKLLWRRSLMEEIGRNTYPNGRTGAPAIEGDFVIVRGVTANWGTQGPPRDRYYAYDKRTGDPVWESTACLGPPYLKDSSFSSPVFDWWEGRRVFYTALGSGAVVCCNAWTGEPIWRSQQIVGGFNCSVALHQGKVIAIHSGQNLDTTETGRMLAIKIPKADRLEPGKVLELGPPDEAWRNPLSMFTSSPTLAGDRLYQVVETGDLFCIDANTGDALWSKKLGPSQLHASPLWGDGKLYVPVEDGTFWILKPTDAGAEELAKVKLAGGCLGSPAAWNGKVYVHTTKKLYCFGAKGDNTANLPAPVPKPAPPAPGAAVRLQIVPSEVLLRPGEKATFRVYAIDQKGQRVGLVSEPVAWAKFIPPTALVKAEMDAAFNEKGELVVGPNAKASAGSWRATAGRLSATMRGRVVVRPPYQENFDSFALSETHAIEGVKFAYPPLPWIGGRFRWEVRERDGEKVLAKTTDNPFLSRALTFIGHPEESDYTIAADLLSEGNRRGMGEMGVINQRYIIKLKGNEDKIEVNSNYERLRVSAPFTLTPKVWYRLKARVDVAPDGTGMIRAKAWKRGEPEPPAWTIEVKHEDAHRRGVPGIYAFSAQPAFRVYVDNIEITPNH